MSEAGPAKKRILLVGATGLVGRSIIARTPQLPQVALQGLARREMEFPEGARMELVLADTQDWAEVIKMIEPEAVICALGTTRAKAGSEEEFRAVDHDLVLEVARAAKAAGTQKFVLVSSVGASLSTRNLYLRTKGEIERDVKSLKFKRLDILRPGLLRGKRIDDKRGAEGVGQVLAPLADLFMQGSKTKYRSIKADTLAAAAIQCTLEKVGGQFIHEHDSLKRISDKYNRDQGGEQ